MTTEQLIPSQKTVSATLRNQSPNQIFCERYFNWSNSPGPFPPPIPSDGVVDFKTFGLTGAVLYNGLDAAGKPIGWALAWAAAPIRPGGLTGAVLYKVYVTCGTKSYIDNLTEKELLECLAKSGAESKATDPASKTTVKAYINGVNDPNQPAIASLLADFGVIA